MKGAAKRKVVTSGRLTGGVKVQPVRRRVTPNPGPAACPRPAACPGPAEPAYSLYSTDSEDQVITLHKGLDRCAALLSGILQADTAGPLREVKGGAAKSKSSPSLGKKTSKKPPMKTDQKSSQSAHRGPGSTTPRTHQFSSPAAHSGVILHPPQKHPHTLLQSRVSPSQSQTHHLPSPQPSTCPLQPQPSTNPSTFPLQPQPSTSPSTCPLQPQPSTSPSTCPLQPQPSTSPSTFPLQLQPSILLSVSQSSSLSQTDSQSADPDGVCGPHEAPCDREEDSVPVRDISTQSSATDPHSHIHSCTTKVCNLHLQPQHTHSEEDSSAEQEVKLRTVQYLLGELKALITGQGSIAEKLLSHLEQTVSSPLLNVSSSKTPAESAVDLQSLHMQNTQLRRRVRILNQQLKEREKAERQQNMETLCDEQVLTLQEELTSAQTRLQELQDDLADLRRALQDTQSQLRDREAENALVKTDLEATRRRLLHSEREKSELASLVQQRLEEIENLNRVLQGADSSHGHTLVGSWVSDAAAATQQHRQDPPQPPTDRISQYLMSLDQLEQQAEREGNAAEQTSSHPDLHQSHCLSSEVQPCGRQAGTERRRLFDSTLSQCDVESVTSEWSVRSGSTFDTRDEAAFRDGLAALDASIASLQKTIKLDLGR